MGDKSKKGHRFLVALTVVSVLVIIAVLLVGMVQGKGLNAKIAVAKKVGFPFEGRDLEPKSQRDPSQNAAVNYVNAKTIERSIAFTNKSEVDTILQRSSQDEWTRADWAVLDVYVRESKPVIAEYQIGAAKPYCYFEKDWDMGANVLFPEYSEIKALTKTVLVRAQLRASAGDTEGAAADLESVHRTAVHLASQPPIIALLVSIAIESMGSKTMERLLPAASKDKRLADALRARAAELTDKWDLTGTLKCEAFYLWWCSTRLRDFTAMTGFGNEPLEIKLTKNSQTTMRAVQSSALDIFTPVLRDYEPFEDERAVLEDVERRTNIAIADAFLAKYYLEVLMPVWNGLANPLDRARARKASLLAALDVIEYRRSRGAWPRSLADAGGSYLDPFDRKPLRYKTDGTGFRVWSVGINGKDDGGKTREETRSDDHDEVIVYPPTPK